MMCLGLQEMLGNIIWWETGWRDQYVYLIIEKVLDNRFGTKWFCGCNLHKCAVSVIRLIKCATKRDVIINENYNSVKWRHGRL